MQQEYLTGSLVKIAKKEALEEFVQTWKYHHKLQPEQLKFADKIGKVEFMDFIMEAMNYTRWKGFREYGMNNVWSLFYQLELDKPKLTNFQPWIIRRVI